MYRVAMSIIAKLRLPLPVFLLILLMMKSYGQDYINVARNDGFIKLEGTVAESILVTEKPEKVMDATKPIPNAVVVLCDARYEVQYIVTTDERGKFEMVIEPAKEYIIVADKSGYAISQHPIRTSGTLHRYRQETSLVLAKKNRRSTPSDIPEEALANIHKMKQDFLSQRVSFRIQLGYFSHKVPLELFADMIDLREIEKEGNYIYTAGDFRNFKKAQAYLREELVPRIQYKDAFIVAYYNGEKVPISQVVDTMASR